jgi:SEC-C motif-containing protein
VTTEQKPARPVPAPDERCPCLSGEVYGVCCGPLHSGAATAPTAERLMRSRYSAYAVGDVAYLSATWHPSTRPDDLELDPAVRWYRLDILGTTRGGMLDTRGTVEFVARWKSPGETGQQHENSTFVKLGPQWVYVDAL